MHDFGNHRINTKTNTPLSLGIDCSPEAYTNSNWIAAIVSWDFNDPLALTEMLKNHPVPFELQPIIADIISGARQQKNKASVKQKVPAAHRVVIAGLYKTFRNIAEKTISGHAGFNYHDLAEEKGLEPIELLREYRECLREYDSDFAENLGINISTLRALVKDLEAKLKSYPNI